MNAFQSYTVSESHLPVYICYDTFMATVSLKSSNW